MNVPTHVSLEAIQPTSWWDDEEDGLTHKSDTETKVFDLDDDDDDDYKNQKNERVDVKVDVKVVPIIKKN